MIIRTEVYCPCCGDIMESHLVVCWDCYRITNKLQAGFHLNPLGTTASDEGYGVQLTNELINKWDTERTARVS